MIHDNLSVTENGHLAFAGRDTVELAQKYGTPVYLMDEERIRQRIRTYKEAFEAFFPEGSMPEYASKAFSCKSIYRILAEEGINADVVSVGELYTALKAGFSAKKCFFHGNDKTDRDIEFAIKHGVGHFVADSLEEVYSINKTASDYGIIQSILLRVTPGIDPHTHQKISTGSVDSKFGIALETGQAAEAVKEILSLNHIKLCGFHCHVGSQVFDSEVFSDAAKIMLTFIKDMKATLGYTAEILNLGGGFGVRYTENDPTVDYRARIKEIADTVNSRCDELGIDVPKIMMEPGRSLVADSGITLYTVGSVKTIPDYKTYVSVDGGMTDNPRYALYEAKYTVINASKADKTPDLKAVIAGRCCESGDLIGEDVPVATPVRGDILAVLSTGAYNYSMASNYNRVPRPPVIMLTKNGEYTAVERETLDDIIALDK